jgi:ATP-dependent DNA helicase RecQ
LRLGEVRERLGSPQVLALTATASSQVMDDILEHPRLDAPAIVNTGIVRENTSRKLTSGQTG